MHNHIFRATGKAPIETMPITLLDGILLVFMLVSALLAMVRGFSREVFSLASWVAAAFGAYFFFPMVLPKVQDYITSPIIAKIVTVILIFVVILFLVSFITMKMADFILDSRIGPLDRSLGFLFGAFRGLLLVVIAVALFDGFSPPGSPGYPKWISQAKSKPMLDSMIVELTNILPDDPESDILDRFISMISSRKKQEPAATQSAKQVTRDKLPDAGYRSDQREDLEQLINNNNNTAGN